MAIADVFDALIHARRYKGAWTLAEALTEIKKERGLQFDPQVVDALPRVQERERGEPPLNPTRGNQTASA